MAKKLPKWKIDLQKVVDMAMKQVLDETTANDIPIREWIDKIASGEYQPVKHGRWIDHEMFERNNCNPCIECSVCNTWFGCDCFPKTKFCPNCGSKNRMDGDGE